MNKRWLLTRQQKKNYLTLLILPIQLYWTYEQQQQHQNWLYIRHTLPAFVYLYLVCVPCFDVEKAIRLLDVFFFILFARSLQSVQVSVSLYDIVFVHYHCICVMCRPHSTVHMTFVRNANFASAEMIWFFFSIFFVCVCVHFTSFSRFIYSWFCCLLLVLL